MVAHPGHPVRPRHQHRLARQGRRGRRRHHARRGRADGDHRAARDGRHDVPARREPEGRLRRHPDPRRGRPLNRRPRDPQPGTRLVGRRTRPVLDAARLHPLRAGAAARRRARRRAHPVRGDGRPGLHQPDRRPGVPRRDPHRRPADHRRPAGRAGLDVGPRAAAQHRGPAGPPPGRHRRMGGPVQHPLLHRPHHRRLRLDLHQLPALHRAGRRLAGLRRVRGGPLRRALSTRGGRRAVPRASAQARQPMGPPWNATMSGQMAVSGSRSPSGRPSSSAYARCRLPTSRSDSCQAA